MMLDEFPALGRLISRLRLLHGWLRHSHFIASLNQIARLMAKQRDPRQLPCAHRLCGE
jgi:hypothetical protein